MKSIRNGLILCMIVLFFVIPLHTINRKENTVFSEHQNEFNYIKKITLLNSNWYGEKEIYSIMKDESRNIVGMYGFPVPLDDNALNSLNLISEAFKYDFSFISVSNGRVSFGGDGYEMYVYMLNYSRPDYFYHRNDGMNFSVTPLKNGWYYLFSNHR